MTWQAPLGAAALLAVPAILLLYFLKVKRPETRVASLLFWRPFVADRQANAPWQRLRSSWLLVLQLLAALAIALALLRPGVTGAAGIADTTIVILDGSASMQASDVGPTRFGAAVDQARGLVSQLPAGKQMAIVLLGQHAQLLSAPSGDPAVLMGALDRARPTAGEVDLGEGLSLANAVLTGHPNGSILLLGDGHARAPAAPPKLLAPLTYEQVGSTGENVGIEAIARTAGGTVFVRVADYGKRDRDLRLELRADGRLVDVLPVRVTGGSTADVTWSGLPNGAQVLEARLTPGDSFALDDTAWLVTGAPSVRQVELVTAENGFLQRALELRPGIKVTVVKPADYKPSKAYDLFVFDGFVPPGTLPSPALLVGPPQGQGPAPLGPGIAPGIVLPGTRGDPLLQDVVLKDVHVQVAGRATPPPGWRVVFGGADDPLLLASVGEPRLAELTFDIHHSDLPLRAAFPILIQNLLSYLMPGGFENQVYAPGRPVTLAAETGAKSVDVIDPGGRSTRLLPPFPPYSPATPGVYTVRQQLPDSVRVSRFVVDFADQALSRILPGPKPAVQVVDRPANRASRGVLELWPWLAAAALLLLAAEWFVFHRGP